jgi:purine-binding chemotaxis protein CheW
VSLDGGLPRTKQVLVVLARTHRCALPLEHVVETMRPLPIQAVANTASAVLGVSIIRGQPLPVVDLGALLADSGVRGGARTSTRFVTVRLGARHAAFAVEGVVGVRTLQPNTLHELPPLLRRIESDTVGALGVLDRELVAVLDSGRLLPDSVWEENLATDMPLG